jgi:hypothetical protein
MPLTGTGTLWETFVGSSGSSANVLLDVTGYFTP